MTNEEPDWLPAQNKGQPEVLLVMGTRPEAVKLAPVALAMAASGRVRPVLVASGQHPAMVDQALAAFDLAPDEVLRLDRRTGDQAELAGLLIPALDELVRRRRPASVVVQGDTATTLAGALVAFWRRIPVVHLEAGLRSNDLSAPFPEEGNRRMVGQIAALHLPPTPSAAANLAAEGIVGPTVLTIGNTVVDAALRVAEGSGPYYDERLTAITDRVRSGDTRLVLVTAHRRESWGGPLGEVLAAVAELVAEYPDVEVVLPAHPNPDVRAQVDQALSGVPRVVVTPPLAYPDLIRLLRDATLVLSDSGGIQEEAPTFGVPVLVLRDVTERMEAVRAGCARLVGTDRRLIVATARRLLDNDAVRQAMVAGGNPFGDGEASARTEQAVAWLCGLAPHRPTEFVPSGRSSEGQIDAMDIGEDAP